MRVGGVYTHASGELQALEVPVLADGAGYSLDDTTFGPDAWSEPQDDGLTHDVYSADGDLLGHFEVAA